MSDHGRYLFDLQGFLVVEDLLTDEERAACNEALDRHQHLIRPRPREQSLSGGSASLQGEEGRLEITRCLLQLEKPWCEPFRSLLAHPKIVPYLTELIGAGFRLDHGPVLIGGRAGTEGHVLHGGGEPYDPAQYYFHKKSWLHFPVLPRRHAGGVICAEALPEYRTGVWYCRATGKLFPERLMRRCSYGCRRGRVS